MLRHSAVSKKTYGSWTAFSSIVFSALTECLSRSSRTREPILNATSSRKSVVDGLSIKIGHPRTNRQQMATSRDFMPPSILLSRNGYKPIRGIGTLTSLRSPSLIEPQSMKVQDSLPTSLCSAGRPRYQRISYMDHHQMIVTRKQPSITS